jgi:dUTPase
MIVKVAETQALKKAFGISGLQSEYDFEIKNGERIAQMILSKHEIIDWQPAQDLSKTNRGTGGYGSTGK